ncbi:HDOD domain-containing protein [Desulfonatronum thiodismutans]|uniref:HDOD domain-containing protein n=1 Tax=Desulfonatronum thiodismutans TaxID=159290 RepID=UPI0004ABE0DC|nr:HDOD domain-containing protein [Desulfonatronum thiodismutans]
MGIDRDRQARSSGITASLRSMISHIEELPVLPTVAVRALTLSMRDDVDLTQLARVMEADPVLTAKILRLVNNAQAGLPTRVGTVKQAVALAGLNQVRCALLGVLVKDYLPETEPKIADMSKLLWTHSLVTAVLADLIAAKTFPELRETAFVGGLLHDIGKLVIMDIFPDIALQIDELRKERCLSTMEAEFKILDTDHCTVGKILAQHWKLPEELVDCIWLHHHRLGSMDRSSLNWEVTAIVSLANHLAKEMLCDVPERSNEDSLIEALLTALNLEQAEVAALRGEARREYELKAAFFDLESDLSIVFHQIIQKANRSLAELGIELDVKNTRLSKMNALLGLANKIGLDLGNVHNKTDLFQALAQAFNGFSAVPVGIFYTIDHETRELEGVVWIDGGRKRRLLCFTDRNGTPIWEQTDQNLPPDLCRILANAKQRLHYDRTIAQSFSSPFLIFSFGMENCYFAELCISLAQEYRPHPQDNFTGFSQIAQLLRSSLENVLLFESLQCKKEDLAQALWRTEQINHQLIQTERLAAVGQLAAGAAHEINNPLAIISARAQLLELKEQDEKRKQELALISVQIERISKILTNLMDFARPAPPNLQKINIHLVLDRVLELVATNFRKYKITLVKQYDDRIVPIKADPNQLEQVFLNLIINAQHAMEEKGGQLTVVTEFLANQQAVLIRIQDQGVGIARENLKKIFDPFFSTKAEGKGTGLGLSTSLGIINNHFGKIDIDSTPGKGTTFSVELPVDISALRPMQSEACTSSATSLGLRPRILVVDDEEHIRDVLKETLENEGFEVMTANNGNMGRDMLEAERFDLLLLDIKMPYRDGLSLLRELRASPTNAGLQVLVITGTASPDEMGEIANHSCKCLRKPFHIKKLLAEVHFCLRKTDG